MYGLTRGVMTLIGVAVAGFLIWFGISAVAGDESVSNAEFWWAAAMIALGGLAIALSQLLGGWTKWGWPRVSGNVFLFGFLPALMAGGWVLLASQPAAGGRVRGWSEDLGIDGLVGDVSFAWTAVAFALGLVFGLTFDTTGPRVRDRDAVPAGTRRRVGEGDGDRRERGTPVAPQPEPAPRTSERDRREE